MAAGGGRIKFPGNPWPRGHEIKKAKWTAELTPEGLRFHFHVETRDYDAEDDREDEGDIDDDWKARGAWTNYHSCTLSSTMWGHPGFVVATPGKPIDLEKLEGKTFRVDRVVGKTLKGVDLDDLKFGIYLLGHDSVCEHRIRFVKRRGPGTYDIAWRARIALTYVGKLELAHSLVLDLPKLPFSGIELPADLPRKAAKELLPNVIKNSDRYRTFRP